jgi:hypothetical protein
VAGALPLAGTVVSTRRLAAVAGQSAALSAALVAQSALAGPCALLGGLAPLSAARSGDLAGLFGALVDDSLAPMWIFVLILCSESCFLLSFGTRVKGIA